MTRSFVLFLLGLICFLSPTRAQQEFKNLDSLKPFVVHPLATPISPKQLPFRKIVLIDSRFDTSKVGYVNSGHTYKRLTTKTTFDSTLQEFLNKRYTSFASASSLTLLIVIKKFWLEDASPAEQKKYRMAKASETTVEQATCLAGFDVYMILGESYIPVFKLDTVYTQEKLLKKCVNELIVQPFDFCISKIGSMDFSKIEQAKVKLSWAKIDNYNKQRMDFPRFENDIFERGIYKTFNDFLQNKVTKQDFKTEFGVQTDELFITENGKPVLLTDFWGLCDGEKNYVKVGFNFFELVRTKNTYELWGSKLTVDESFRYPASNNTVATAIIGNTLLNSNRVENNYKPLQLNMETGEVY